MFLKPQRKYEEKILENREGMQRKKMGGSAFQCVNSLVLFIRFYPNPTVIISPRDFPRI